MFYLYLVVIFLISVHDPAAGQDYQVRYDVDPPQNINARFRLFKTGNIFTFLELDTRSGFIYQVQYSISAAPIGCICINGKELFEAGDTPRDSRFTLYPTQNLYNFILVDQDKGKLWQCQWSLCPDPKKKDGMRM